MRGIRRKPSANPRSDEQKPDIRHDYVGETACQVEALNYPDMRIVNQADI